MKQRIALVTNVLDFVGPPAVRALCENGFSVIAQDGAFTDEAIALRYRAEFAGVSTTAISEPQSLINMALELNGHLDVLVSNDAFGAIHNTIEDASVSDLQETLDHLVLYPFRLMQAALPVFKKQQSGNVIMITSCRTELPLAEGAIPDMARAAANALVTSLSLELAPFQVPVNAIAPNYLYSEAYFPKAKFIDDPAGRKFIQEVVPAGRLGRPEEMEELVAYLANMQGSFHTGSVIKFAGGWPAAPKRPA